MRRQRRKLPAGRNFQFHGQPLRWPATKLSQETTMYPRQALIELFQQRALKFGEFTLVSGKKASYYLDGKQVTLHSQGLRLIAEGLLDLLSDVEFEAIGGMSIGAD